MLTIITDQTEIEQVYHIFIQTLALTFNEKVDASVGFQGGNFEEKLHYSPTYDLWFGRTVFNRYWNGFGEGKPKKGKNNSILVEINFPLEGLNRRIAGVFAFDEEGKIFVLHRGKIGGGKVGIGKKLFVTHFKGEKITAKDGFQTTDFYLVGHLFSKEFPEQLASFVKEIIRIKNLI